jgi:hypothetical protein
VRDSFMEECSLNNARPFLLGFAALILVGAVLVLLMGGPPMLMGRVMNMGAAPGDADTAASRVSDQGIFHVWYISAIDPVPINQIHSWTLGIETVSGQPVDQAEITVSGGMPQHGHGLPTRPQVTQNLGEGNYLVEGLRFHMPGWWEVKFNITADGESDSVTFYLQLR